MGNEGVSGRGQSSFEARRAEGKAAADRLRARCAAKGDLLGWFDALYREAGGDRALIPWGHGEARPELAQWLEQLPKSQKFGRALDMGCGLGDNAALLAVHGFKVTAFDISKTAVRWAAKRFGDLGIDWQVANLVEPMAAWRGAFEFINETYTVQALREPKRSAALPALATCLASGGRLFILGRARHAGEPLDPPPWPLEMADLEGLEAQGLKQVSLEDFVVAHNDRGVRHFRALYRRAE